MHTTSSSTPDSSEHSQALTPGAAADCANNHAATATPYVAAQAVPDAPTGAAAQPDLIFMLQHLSHVIALGLGSGLARTAPGTVGTLFAWGVFALFSDRLGSWSAGSGLLAFAALFIVGIWACQKTAQRLHQADPGCIVWDEIVAFWFILWVATPVGLWAQFWAFCWFRIFDSTKPGPIASIDQHFKAYGDKGWYRGLGIMLDDLLAALFTLLVLAVWRTVF